MDSSAAVKQAAGKNLKPFLCRLVREVDLFGFIRVLLVLLGISLHVITPKRKGYFEQVDGNYEWSLEASS
jgi:hypothetical protein